MRRAQRRRRCESCRYDLRGATSTRCPECGHDVSQPVRLLRLRRVLLHTLLIVALLTASHLVYRIDAIKKRGWVAAVPTTVLIVCLPHQGVDFSDRGIMSQFAGEMTCRLGSGWIPPDPRDDLAQWQYRWVIRKAFDAGYGPDVEATNWRDHAVDILRGAHARDYLNPSQRTRLERMCYFIIQTRRVWPLGEIVEAGIDQEYIVRGDGIRFTAHALTAGYEDDVVEDMPTGLMIVHPSVIHGVPPRSLGKAVASGPVEYELLIERYRRDSGAWEVISREKRVLTMISESRAPDLTTHELPDSALASLSPALRIEPDSTWDSGVRLIMHASHIFETALGQSSFAVTVTLYRDGVRFGTGKITWGSARNRKTKWIGRYGRLMRWLPTEEWTIPIEAMAGQSWPNAEPLEDHEWTITIEGNPALALHDFEATSCWAGKYEFKSIPVERVKK